MESKPIFTPEEKRKLSDLLLDPVMAKAIKWIQQRHLTSSAKIDPDINDLQMTGSEKLAIQSQRNAGVLIGFGELAQICMSEPVKRDREPPYADPYPHADPADIERLKKFNEKLRQE